MKNVTVEICVFEKGDRVLTSNGEATVVQNENPQTREVKIRLDDLDGCCGEGSLFREQSSRGLIHIP